MTSEHRSTGTAGLRSETVRSANLAMILREVHRSGALSRSELVARTGLTRSGVGALVSELVRVGLVEETTVQSGSPGRPSLMVAPASSTNVAIAVDLAVDSLTVAAVGLGGVVLAREVVEREPGERRGDDDEVQHDVDSAVAEIERSIQRLVSSLDPASRTLGVGVGVVGLVNRHDGSVAVAPNLGWRDVALAKLLSEALSDTVDVAVANEADLAAYNAIYREYFSDPYPTRNTIGVKELWGGAQVGFDVWAVVE